MTFPTVHRFTGRFMQLPRDHVNAFVVELDSTVVVVDSTLAPSDARALREMANSFGKPIAGVLLTHGHPDHFWGLVAFPDVPRYASRGCLEFAQREDITKAETARTLLGDDFPESRIFPNEIIEDGTVLTFDGISFTFRDLGPGESDSDGMWVFHEGSVTHVFTGDTIALNCHCFFRDGHAHEWIDNLDRLEHEFDNGTRLYLGHGASPVGTEALHWQRGYVKSFLHGLGRLKSREDPAAAAGQEELMAVMKTYLPSEANLFLLQYELDVTIARFLAHEGVG